MGGGVFRFQPVSVCEGGRVATGATQCCGDHSSSAHISQPCWEGQPTEQAEAEAAPKGLPFPSQIFSYLGWIGSELCDIKETFSSL